MTWLTSTRVRELFDYQPETGVLTWLPRPLSDFATKRAFAIWNSRFAGKPAGTVGTRGYVVICIRGETHSAHQVAWVYMTGQRHEGEIDHIDGDRANNRWVNLRGVTRRENGRNQAKPKHNTSGVVGVTFDTKAGRWMANIMVSGRTKTLGRFDMFEDAVAARKAAEVRFDFHPNHGRAAA